jgi:sec-independent protein translocase protein TatA
VRQASKEQVDIMWPMATFFSPTDIGIVAVVALVLFGGTKIRDFARGAGQGIKEFKQAVREDEPASDPPPPAPTPTSTTPTNTTGTPS